MNRLLGRAMMILCVILTYTTLVNAENWSEFSKEEFSTKWWFLDDNNIVKEGESYLTDPPPAEPVCGCIFPPTPIGYTSIVSANECKTTPYPQCVLETCIVAVYDDEDNFIRRTTYYCSAFGPTN